MARVNPQRPNHRPGSSRRGATSGCGLETQAAADSGGHTREAGPLIGDAQAGVREQCITYGKSASVHAMTPLPNFRVSLYAMYPQLRDLRRREVLHPRVIQLFEVSSVYSMYAKFDEFSWGEVVP